MSFSRPAMTMLIAVLVLGSMALIVGVSIALQSISEVDIGISTQQTIKALAASEACAEEALLQLKRQGSSFTGTVLSLEGDGTCVVRVWANTESGTFTSTGSVRQWTRQTHVRFTLEEGQVTPTEWRF